MSFCSILTASVEGLNVEFVRAEVDVSNGLPLFHMVGYLSAEVKEASERVRAAVRNLGIVIPARKVVVNLSPAFVRKRGNAFDLPVAAALLCAMGEAPAERLKDTLVVGELGLDGRIRPVAGVLLMVTEGQKIGIRRFVVPLENAEEAALSGETEVWGVENLGQVVRWMRRGEGICRKESPVWEKQFHGTRNGGIDYSDIYGQEGMKRATLVAVAGNHNLLFVGPPGAGKTMMAKRIPTILPELTREECLEITGIYSAAGLLSQNAPLVTDRPFREVHHTVTRAAVTGGGRIPRPGECTLAHGGILFLDELPEFSRSVIEALRQPLEEKCVRLSRQYGAYVFPADFMLVCAMNPCPCGYYPDYRKCICSDQQIRRYLGKISQPFLDRMDVCTEAPRVEYGGIKKEESKWNSQWMKEQVDIARMVQKERFQGSAIHTNSQMNNSETVQFCTMEQGAEKLMSQAYDQMELTVRSFYKILRVARTIADLEESTVIREEHVAEALGYRVADQKYWGDR